MSQENRIIKSALKHKEFFKQSKIPCYYPEKNWQNQYSITKYYKSKQIIQDWNKRKIFFSKRIKEILKTNLSTLSINVYFTLYGPGGSYQLPNSVFINVNPKNIKWSNYKTLEHEVIHLLIEQYISKNNLDYSSKEVIVDFIQNFLLSSHNKKR